jgi:phage tail sheath gpL-like
MSLQPINIIGLGPNDPPGVYLQVQFAQGTPSIGNNTYAAIILANMSSAGSAQTDGYVYGPNTLVGMSCVQDAINLFGAGSPAMRMVNAFMTVNPNTPLYVAPVLAATGSASSLVITLTGTATLSGTIRCNVVGDTPVDTGFLTNDTPTVIAANMAININTQSNLPCTAVAALGVLTLTAKVAGLRGNWLRGSARVLNGAGVTSSLPRQSFFSGGTGSDSYTNVLNFLATNGIRYYRYISEAGCDSVDGTQFEAVKSQIDTLAQPTVGLRQRVMAGSCDTLAHTETATTAANDPRADCVWLQNSDTVPSELATNTVAAYMLFETPPLSANGVNFDGFGNDPVSAPFWNAVSAPLDGSAPSAASIKSAILSGITPIKVQHGGRTSIVKAVTTRFLNGAINDYRITDSGKVTICDYFGDDLTNLLVLRYPRKLVASDPVQGQPPAGPNVVTPSQVRNTVIELINIYSSAGLIDGPSVINSLVVQRETSPSSRIGIRVPLFTNDPLHTFGVSVDQVS